MSPVEKNQKRITNIDKIRTIIGLTRSSEYRWDDILPVFLVSTGRTGTRFLSRLLGRDERIYACQHPHPGLRTLGLDYARTKTSFRAACRKIRTWRRPYARYTHLHSCRCFLESNNYLFSLIDPVRRVIPNARFVHIVRDGRDYVRSGMSRKWYRSDDDTYRLKAPFFPDDPYAEEWTRMSRFEKICWEWQKKDSMIYAHTRNSEDTLHVDFDSIFKNASADGLRRILSFTGIEDKETCKTACAHLAKKHNNTSRFSIPHWSTWTQWQKTTFERIAGDYFRLRFGSLNW